MNPDIMTVADDMTIEELVRYLVEHEISGAPVVDDQGQLVGVVSMTDIGRNMTEPETNVAPPASTFYRDDLSDSTLENLGARFVEQWSATVRDVMTPVIYQVPVTAPISEAARIMVERHIHRLLVTQGKDPVGIITSMDLLRMVANMR
jgi:predicted transcriptional regulator